MQTEEFIALALRNPNNRALLARLPALGLPDAWLTAGCLFQTVWNLRHNQDPQAGIKDYDLFYFDAGDLSSEAESEVERVVARAFVDLPIKLDVKNQARVHTWYETKFGAPYPQLVDARDGIDRYLVACTCVGIAVDDKRLHAPFGLYDLAAGRLRINPRNAQPDQFAKKALSYKARWPWLEIVG